MATRVEDHRGVEDAAGIEGRARVALGITGFRGDGDRLFLQWGETGVLFARDDAQAFLAAASRVAETLERKG